jgi:hypothetical protein
MKALPKLLAAIVLAGTLIACGGQPKLDASSDEAWETSLEQMMAELSPEQQNQLEDDFTTIIMVGTINAFSQGLDQGTDSFEEHLLSLLDGKTAEEINATANELRKGQ